MHFLIYDGLDEPFFRAWMSNYIENMSTALVNEAPRTLHTAQFCLLGWSWAAFKDWGQFAHLALFGFLEIGAQWWSFELAMFLPGKWAVHQHL